MCTADASTLVAYLEGDAPDEAQGCAVMRSLLAHRPQVAHDVTAPGAFDSVEAVPLARSEEEARAFAVPHLKLDALFLGEQTAACATLVS